MKGRTGNKGLLRIIRDDKSHTGLSAAVLVRNIRPRRRKDGSWYITHSRFTSNVKLNCDGVVLRPKVSLLINCNPTKSMKLQAKRNREAEAARAGSPILN